MNSFFINGINDPRVINIINSFHMMIVDLIAQDIELQDVRILEYARVLADRESVQTQIRMGIAQNNVRHFFFVDEEIFESFNDGDEAQQLALQSVINQIREILV